MEEKNLPPPGQTVPPASTQTANSLETAANMPVSSYSGAPKSYPIESLEVHQQGQVQPAVSYVPTSLSVPFSRRKATIVSLLITLIVLLITGIVSAFFIRRTTERPASQLDLPTQDASLQEAIESDLPPELQGLENSLLVNGDVVTRGRLRVVDGTFTTTIGSGNLTGNQTITLPNASGELCLNANNCNFATNDQIAEETAQIDQQAGQLAQQAATLAALQAQLNQISVSAAGVTALNGLGGGIALQGSLNQISVTTGNGVITLSTPQAIDADANVQFGSLTVNSLGTGPLRVIAGTLTIGAIDLGSSDVTGITLVANGGTGVGTLTANGLLIGNGTSPITTVTSGGPGLCLVSTAGAPTFQACPGGGGDVSSLNGLTGALTLQGTANQINVASDGSTITLSTPQDIATTSNVAFNNLTLTGSANIAGFSFIGSGNDLHAPAPETANALTVAQTFTSASTCAIPCAGITSSVQKGNATAVFLDAFRGEVRVGAGQSLQNGVGLFIESSSLGGGASLVNNYGIHVAAQTAGTNDYGVYIQGADTYSLWVDSGATRLDGTLEVQGATATFGTGTQAGSLVLHDGSSNTARLQTANYAANRIYTLPEVGTDATICLSTGNCAGAGTGVTTSGGTTNRLAKFTAGQNIEDSTISDDGSQVTVNGNVNLAVQGANVTVGMGAARTGSLVLNNSTNTNTVTLQSGVTSTSYSLTLPTAVGGADQCLKEQNGTGTLIWADCLGGGGGGITSIDGQTGPAVSVNNATGAGNVITIDDAAADGATKGIAAFNSTNFTAAGGVVNTVQGISTGAAPQFAGLTLTGNLNLGANTLQGTAAAIDFTNFDVDSSGNITAGTYNGQTISSSASFTGTLAVATLGTANSDAVICRNTSTNQLATCNSTFATAGDLAGYVQLQGGTPGTQQTGHVNVSGTGIFGTNVQTPLLDTPSATALSIGTTNATAIDLNKNTTINGNATVTGDTTIGNDLVVDTNSLFVDASINCVAVGAVACGGGNGGRLLVTNSGADTRLKLEARDGEVDPYIWFTDGGAVGYSLGLDDSDSDAFVLSASPTLGTSNVLRATPTSIALLQNTSVSGNLNVDTNTFNVDATNNTIGVRTAATAFGVITIANAASPLEIYGTGAGDLDIGSDTDVSIGLDEDDDGSGESFTIYNDGSTNELFSVTESGDRGIAFIQGWLRLGVDVTDIADTETLSPGATYVEATCTTATNCTINLTDTEASQGQTLVLVSMDATNTITLNTVAGQQQIGGGNAVLGQYDTITLIYIGGDSPAGRWVQLATSNNT